jgi:hypothetical protein
MKKKATKKATARGKKSKLKDLEPKANPKAGLNFAADGSVMPQVGNTGNVLSPLVNKIYNK